MEFPQQMRRNWRSRGVRAATFAALVLLTGCANGDFGEVKPSLVRDDIHDWIGPNAFAGPASPFQLTDDERALRDLSYPLLEQPYNRQRWNSIAGEYGLIGYGNGAVYSPADYSNHLLSGETRSPTSRYARLIDDIRNDSTRLPQFFETAGRVLDMDRKRRKSLPFVAVSPVMRDDALKRIEENRAVVAMVRGRLRERVTSYRFALGNLVIESPSAQAVEVERLLNRLQGQIALYDRMLPPTWYRVPSLAANN